MNMLNYRKWKELETYRAALGHGMIFLGNHVAVVAALQHLPRQDFDVRF